MMPDRSLPPISIILAVRDEQEHLDGCLESLIQLDYPKDHIEIILIDGMSDDRTPAIIDSWLKRDSRIRMLTNPGKIVSTGMNIGLRESRHDLILWTSGHVILETGYLKKCLEVLQSTGAAAVGGQLRTVGVGFFGRMNAAVLSSRFGVGGGRHRVGGDSGWVPAVTMALYRRDALQAVGGWDEHLVRNQDNDLHQRMNAKGLKSYFDTSIRPTYLCRGTFAGFLRQGWSNGFWTVMMTRLGRSGHALRNFIPMIFVTTLLGLAVFAGFAKPAFLALIVLVAVYGVAAIISSLAAVATNRLSWHVILLPVWFLSLHVAYGLGSWAGLLSPKPQTPDPQ